jgi:DNA-binding transcriptional MerR regulator
VESLAAEGLMQVGDLARESGKTVRAIHLYEELDLLRPAARSKGRFRLYGNEALLRIRWISKLQDLGFSLTDIQAVARDFDAAAETGSATTAMARMRTLYQTKLEETRAHLERLRALETEIVASLAYLETCDVCDPQRVVASCTKCDQHDRGQEAPELVAGFRAKPSAAS